MILATKTVLSLIAALAGPTLVSGRTEPPPAGCELVTIESGQTLGLLAKRHGAEIGEIEAWNPQIGDIDLIWPGESVCVSQPETVMVETTPAPEAPEVEIELAPAVVQEAPADFDHSWTGYDRAKGRTDGPEPGTIALAEAILDLDDELSNLGIFNPRKARGSARWSTHAEGRALDIGFVSCDSGIGDLAFTIGVHLANNHQLLGVQRILVCDQEWTANGGWRESSPQLTAMHSAPAHLHLEQTREGAANLTAEIAAEVASWVVFQ